MSVDAGITDAHWADGKKALQNITKGALIEENEFYW